MIRYAVFIRLKCIMWTVVCALLHLTQLSTSYLIQTKVFITSSGVFSSSSPHNNVQNSNEKFNIQGFSRSISRLNESTAAKVKELLAPFLDDDLFLHTIKEWERPLPPKDLLRPLVLVGPSGVGKGRLIKAILKDYSRYFGRIVSHTTRAPRPEEREGVHYFYVSQEEFNATIRNNSFIEWAMVHGNFYGTSLKAWKHVQAQGKIGIFEIDIQGARAIRNISRSEGISPKFIFVAPPHVDVLRERLDIRYSTLSLKLFTFLKYDYYI